MKIQKQIGVTLIELMVSMVLGLLIIGSSLQVFLMIKKIAMLQQGMSRIQENARVAKLLLQELITTSGNFGCNRLAEDLTVEVHSDVDLKIFGLNSSMAVEGAHFSKLMPTVKRRVKRKVPSSDILWLKKMKDSHIYSNKNVQASFDENTVIVISDCKHIEILKNKHESTREYAENAEIGILSSTLLYAGNTYRNNANGFPINALYSTDINGRTIELIEGVEDFKVLYGTRNGEISYWDLDNLPLDEKIVQVKIRLLFTSIEDALAAPQAYQIDGKKHIPKDRLMRMWWTYEFPTSLME